MFLEQKDHFLRTELRIALGSLGPKLSHGQPGESVPGSTAVVEGVWVKLLSASDR